jgi:preprotein translocase subunit SecE
MTTENATGTDPKRLVVVFYVLAAIALGFFFEKVFGVVFTYAHWNDVPVLGEDWTVTTLLGFALSFAIAAITGFNPKAQAVSLEIASELKKVTWPTLRETRAATVAVVIATAISGALLFAFDALWGWLSSKVY